MPHEATRNTIVRLMCFAALWLVALAVWLSQRCDPRMMTKVGLFVVFLVPTILLFWFIQRVARYRIPWLIELFALPFAAGGLVYAAAAIRGLLTRAA